MSFRNSAPEPAQAHQSGDLALECYQAAIRNISHYALELGPDVTAPYRNYLEELAANIAAGTAETLNESRATLRSLIRDYRDKTAEYLAELREELAGAATALQQIMESLGQSDGDHDLQMRNAISRLRAIACPPGEVRDTIFSATKIIEFSLEQVRKQHQLTVSQFLMEIRMLHKRIDALETAATIDTLTKLFTREEVETRIRGMQNARFHLLLIKTFGLRIAERQHNKEVAEELAAAFTKRLRNSLPPGTMIGRWSEEEFVAMLQLEQPEVAATARKISASLAGAYACLKAGKTVRPVIQLRVGVVDRGADPLEKVLQKIKDFLTGV